MGVSCIALCFPPWLPVAAASVPGVSKVSGEVVAGA